MPKISVIIPVYNTEKYIEKCLESLAKQEMQDFEVIVVNDGSTDNSENVIKNYMQSSKLNIKYLEKENGGLASARNYGVEKASGKYISFLDSDDYLDKNLFSELEKYIDKDIDLIKFKMKTVDEKGRLIEKLDGPVFDICSGKQAYEKLCTSDKYMDPACIYLYKREFFVENNFKYKLRYHEDFGLTSLIIVQAKTVVSTDICGYNYLQTEESLTRSKDDSKNIDRAKDMLIHYDNMLAVIDANYDLSEKTKELVKRYYTNSVVLKAGSLKGKEKRNYIKEIKYRMMYKNIKPENLKQKIKRILLKYNISLYLKMR